MVARAGELFVLATGAHALSVIRASSAVVQLLAHIFSHFAALLRVLLIHLGLSFNLVARGDVLLFGLDPSELFQFHIANLIERAEESCDGFHRVGS